MRFIKKQKGNIVELYNSKQQDKKNILYYLKRDYILYLLVVPAVAYFFIFKYIPMYGATIAFKDYNIFKGINDSEWIGFDMFKRVFKENFFWVSARNTIVLNILTLVFTLPLSIATAILLNEVKSKGFQRTSQSLLYLPYFVSWVAVSGIVVNLVSLNNGSINNILAHLGFDKIPFLANSGWWIFTYIIANIWKDVGWGTIIYLAALSGVDESLYEAAYMDGASKLKRIWYITLPCIRPTVVIMLILSVSRMMNIGLDAPLLLQNSKVIGVSEVLSTYVYKIGLQQAQYSFATAVGLFQSVINIGLLLLTNWIANAIGEDGIL